MDVRFVEFIPTYKNFKLVNYDDVIAFVCFG